MKKILSILLSLVLVSGMFSVSVNANEPQFITIEVVHQRGYYTPVKRTLSVIKSGEDLLFSGEDLAALGGFQYHIENGNAFFTRGLKTLRVELKNNKLYPLEDITVLSAIKFDEKIQKIGYSYYFSGAEMLPWLNVNCFIHDDILNVQTDDVSIWDIIPEFKPETVLFDFTECCKELGVDSKYLKARAYLQGEEFCDKFYDLIPFADYLEWYDLFEDILLDCSAVEKEIEGVLKSAKNADYFIELANDYSVVEELPDEFRVFSEGINILSNNAIPFVFDLSMYVKYFYLHNKNIMSALTAMDSHPYRNDVANLPEAADIGLTMLREHYSDYYAGIEHKMIMAIGETSIEGLADISSGFYKWAFNLIGLAEATSPRWAEAVNRISSYDIIAEFAIDTFYEDLIVCDVVELRGLAYMYLYACEQNWTAMAEYANKKGKEDLGAMYEAYAANAEEWQQKFLSVVDAQQNDSYKYGDAVEDNTLGGMKEEYSQKLKKIFATISRLWEENDNYKTPRLEIANYQCQHSYSEYENLLTTMEICFWERTFESLDKIQDLDIYFSWFVSVDYSDEVIEQWYDEKNQIYDIPGEVFRNTMCKHFAFDQIKLEEYFPGSSEENPYASWYDVKNDIYHGWIGGFGGYHDGYDKLIIEVLEKGVIKVTGLWKSDDGKMITSSIIVEESANDGMRLKAYTHDVTECIDEVKFSSTQNPTVLEATKGEVTLTGTLEFRSAESSSGNGYVKEAYILHLDPPIEELIYYDLDSETNAVATDIAEMDILSDLGGNKGEYHGNKITITGEIYPNYTSYYFTFFSIGGETFMIH